MLQTKEVRMTKMRNEETTVSEAIAQRSFPEGAALATVGVDVGCTVNTGNYSSVRLGVHVSLPCYPDRDAVEGGIQEAKDIANAALKEMVEGVKR